MTFYKGKTGQWSWIFHRLTGVGVLFFLFAHIIDTMLVGWGPEVFDKVMSVYAHPLFRTGEVFLFASVLYHSLNGVRIIMIDFWPGMTKYHAQIFKVMMVLFTAIMIPVGYLMIRHIFS